MRPERDGSTSPLYKKQKSENTNPRPNKSVIYYSTEIYQIMRIDLPYHKTLHPALPPPSSLFFSFNHEVILLPCYFITLAAITFCLVLLVGLAVLSASSSHFIIMSTAFILHIVDLFTSDYLTSARTGCLETQLNQ